MPLQIIRNDITKVKADAIVNTANPEVAVGAGVDEAIYKAAGFDELLAERAKIGHMDPGQAAVTPAFGLDADYIIHTVGPAWIDGEHGEREAVASCYRESLKLAEGRECESIAFPLISTGTYGFPKDDALKIAINEISSFLFEHDMTVYMVVYDKESFVLSGKAFDGVQSFIEEEDVKPRMMSESSRRYSSAAGSLYERREKAARISSKRKQIRKYERKEFSSDTFDNLDLSYVEELDKAEDTPDVQMSMSIPDYLLEEEMPAPAASERYDETLGEAARRRVETFQEMLFRHIDRKGYTDPEVYKRANMDRKLFSKIRSNADYIPTKRNVIALAIALRLNFDETIDLLQRAGYALSPSIEFDRIVAYCIQHKIFDIYEVNTYLFNYTEQCLA